MLIEPTTVKTYSTRQKDISDEQIAEVLLQFSGFQAKVAKFLECSTANISQRIRSSTYLQAIKAECKEKRLDEAESSLFDKVLEGHFQAIQYFLETHGKSRGYGQMNKESLTPEMIERFNKSMDGISDIQSELKKDSKLMIKV